MYDLLYKSFSRCPTLKLTFILKVEHHETNITLNLREKRSFHTDMALTAKFGPSVDHFRSDTTIDDSLAQPTLLCTFYFFNRRIKGSAARVHAQVRRYFLLVLLESLILSGELCRHSYLSATYLHAFSLWPLSGEKAAGKTLSVI